MRGRRWRSLWGRVWLLLSAVLAWRKLRAREQDVARHVYRQQTRGLGVRMGEFARDRLRAAWLRLRRSPQ